MPCVSDGINLPGHGNSKNPFSLWKSCILCSVSFSFQFFCLFFMLSLSLSHPALQGITYTTVLLETIYFSFHSTRRRWMPNLRWDEGASPTQPPGINFGVGSLRWRGKVKRRKRPRGNRLPPPYPQILIVTGPVVRRSNLRYHRSPPHIGSLLYFWSSQNRVTARGHYSLWS